MIGKAQCDRVDNRIGRATRSPYAAMCLLAVCLAICGAPGCKMPPADEASTHDPFADWIVGARPQASGDRVWGWSEKARETERRLGYH